MESAVEQEGEEARVLVETLRACLLELEARGLSLSEVAAKTGCSPDKLERGRERLGWNHYCAVMDLVVEAVGGLDGMRAVGHRVEQDAHSKTLAQMMRALVSPRLVYLGMFRFVWPAMWPDLELKAEVTGPSTLALEVRIPDGLRPCPGWFAMAVGVLERAPRLFGMEASNVTQVEADLEGQSGRFRIDHAASGTIWTQIVGALRAAFAPRAAIEQQRSQVLKLNQRLRELSEARHRTEEALAIKDRFLTNISHELRTPVAGVMGLADMLRTLEPSPAQASLLDEMEAVHHGLLRKIELLIDGSLLLHGKLELAEESFELGDALRAAAERRDVASEALLEIDIDPALEGGWRGDRARITRLVGELLRNALTYTASGAVRLSAGLGSSGEISIEVLDEGEGMSEETLRTALRAFRQGNDALQRERDGMGLGLPLARGLAESMGGTLEVQSCLGEGTRCRVRLPLSRATDEARLVSGSGYVLVVDDIELNRRILRRLVEKAGCTVREAENGAQAVAMAEAERPSVVLMDCQMPVMDGLEATRRIRKLSGGERIAIAAVTAHAQPGYAARCIEAGMDSYWTKPVDRAQLARWLGRRREG